MERRFGAPSSVTRSNRRPHRRAGSSRSSRNERGRPVMARGSRPKTDGLKVFPPPPKGFDALTATKRTLDRHGLPERPDARTQPGLSALWERIARRYGGFEHLAAELGP